MTLAKIQPFCKKDNIVLGFYNKDQRTILPKSIKEGKICLYLHYKPFWPDLEKDKSKFHRYNQRIREKISIRTQPHY